MRKGFFARLPAGGTGQVGDNDGEDSPARVRLRVDGDHAATVVANPHGFFLLLADAVRVVIDMFPSGQEGVLPGDLFFSFSLKV